MKVPRLQAVELAWRVRDRQTLRLAGKTADEAIAFYWAAVKPPWWTLGNERSRAAARPDDHLKDS